MALPTIITRTYNDPALANPAGITIDGATGRLFVARAASDRVVWGDAAAATPAFVSLGMFGTSPTAEGFSAPTAVAMDGSGALLVLDAGNGEIDRYVANGGGYVYDAAFLSASRRTFTGTSLAQPSAIVVVGGVLYILDAGHGRVVRVDLATGASSDVVTASGWSQASGLAVTPTGDVYVADTFHHRVLKFPSGGAATVTIGSFGAGAGQLHNPRGLALDAAGNVFVADSGNQRIQVFDATGVAIGTIGAGTFGSVRHLAFDAGGDLYASDAAHGVVYRFGAAASGPILRLEQTVREYGSVGAGYALDRPIVVHNDGNAILHVTSVTSSNIVFAPIQTTLTVPAGGAVPCIVRFSPTVAGFATAVIEFTSDSATGPLSSIVARGTGTAPPVVDACLVLDRSGSMYQSVGSQTKMAALQSAANMFVDLARAGTGDRISIVDFDSVATLDLALTQVTDTAPSSRAAAHAAINALTPRAATSIGGGMEAARTAFAAAPGTGRKALVVVTDGMENTAPFVRASAPAGQRVDLALYNGITMYTVGLGLGSAVDLGLLASLATTFRGSFYLTEDRWLVLPKFFIEIFGDTIGEFVTLDPEFEVVGSTPTEIALDLGKADRTITVAAYWPDPAVSMDLRVITPGGAVITPNAVGAQPGMRYASGAGYALYRFVLPLSGFGRAWDGTWKIVASAPLPRAARMAFGVSVLVESDLGIECEMVRVDDGTGTGAEFSVFLTERGVSILPDVATLVVDGPRYGRGELLARGLGLPAEPPSGEGKRRKGAPPPALPADPRFRERRTVEVPLRAQKGLDRSAFIGAIPALPVEGSYQYHFVCYQHSGGLRLRRECRHNFWVTAYPDQQATDIVVAPLPSKNGGKGRYRITFTLRDALGQRLGPGHGDALTLRLSGAKRGPVRDIGDGSYSIDVSRVDRKRFELRLTLRDRELLWRWDTLHDGEKRPRPSRRPVATPTI